MNKTTFFIAGVLAFSVLTLVIILSPEKLTSFSILSQELSQEANMENSNLHAWTKAICTKGNFCQDYYIECNGQEPVKLSPITGAAVQFDSTWQDPRGIEQRERLCE